MLVRYTIKTTNLSAISVKTDVQVCLLFAFPGVAKLRSHAIFFHLIETIEASFIFKISCSSFVLSWVSWNAVIIWIGVLQIDNVIKTLYMDLKCHRQKNVRYQNEARVIRKGLCLLLMYHFLYIFCNEKGYTNVIVSVRRILNPSRGIFIINLPICH